VALNHNKNNSDPVPSNSRASIARIELFCILLLMSCLSRNIPVTGDLTDVSENGCVIVNNMRKQRDTNKRPTVGRPVSQQMLDDMGTTQHLKLEDEGRIKSFLIGSKRVILTASIYDYLIEEAIRSHPAGQPPLKLDKPLSRRWRERREKAASDAVKEKQATRKAQPGRAKDSVVQRPAGKPAPRLPPLA
jgi:hypothetical protein